MPNEPAQPKLSRKRKREEGLAEPGGYGTFTGARYCPLDSIVAEPWNSDEGRQRLLTSKFTNAFFRLAHVYQPQKNPFFCGVASIVMALNAMRLDQGKVPNQEELQFDHYNPETDMIEQIAYRAYSQLTLLDDATDSIKHRAQIAPGILGDKHAYPFNPGLSLHHVQSILQIYEMEVQLVRAHNDIETGRRRFRDELKRSLLLDDEIIMCNFEGKTIGTTTGGHFSIVGGYHLPTDSVLILDTAAHKTPWYWVDLPHLYYAMNTMDGGLPRGYMIIRDSNHL